MERPCPFSQPNHPCAASDGEAGHQDEVGTGTEIVASGDPIASTSGNDDWGLLPPELRQGPAGQPAAEVLAKCQKIMGMTRTGRFFNDAVRKNKVGYQH